MNRMFRDDNNNNLLCKRNKPPLNMLQNPPAYVAINGLVSTSQQIPAQSTIQPNLLPAPIVSQNATTAALPTTQPSFFATPTFIPGNVFNTPQSSSYTSISGPIQTPVLPYFASINGILTTSNAHPTFSANSSIIPTTTVANPVQTPIPTHPAPTLLLTTPTANAQTYTPVGLNNVSTPPFGFQPTISNSTSHIVSPAYANPIKTLTAPTITSIAPLKLPIPAVTTSISTAVKSSVLPVTKPVVVSSPQPATSIASTNSASPVKKPFKTPDKSLPEDENVSDDNFTDSSLENCDYYKSKVLECIDKLKERKARPDLERISCLMKRLYGIPHKVTSKCLEHLAEIGSVVCVDYKGYVSYRNPSKWRRTSVSNGVTNHPNVSQKLIEAVKILITAQQKTNGDVEGKPTVLGFTLAEVEKSIMKQEGLDIDSFKRDHGDNADLAEAKRTALSEFTPSLRLCIEREVLTGGLSKTPDGKYGLDDSVDKKRAYAALLFNKKALTKTYPKHKVAIARSIDIPKNKPLLSIAPNINGKSTTPVYTSIMDTSSLGHPILMARRGRPPGSKNHKTLRKSVAVTNIATSVLQPVSTVARLADNIDTEKDVRVTDISATAVSATESKPTVAITKPQCPKDVKKIHHSTKCCRCGQLTRKDDDLLNCTDCEISAHPSCLDYWPQLTERARECGWQCGDCKKCNKCGQKSSKQIVICDACDQGYHTACHKPPLSDDHDCNEPWVCQKCTDDGYSLNITDKTPVTNNTDDNKTKKESAATEKSDDVKLPQDSKVSLTKLSNHQAQDDLSLAAEKENSVPRKEKQEPMVVENTLDSRKRHLEENNSAVGNSTPPDMLSPVKQLKDSNESASNGVVTPSQSSKPTLVIKDSPKVVMEPPLTELRDNVKQPSNSSSPRPLPKDIREWSVAHVRQWLLELAYEKEAEAFQNEEIDGACLLLMTKMDILTNLGIKLGPAVKIFEKIKQLQLTCRNASTC